MSACLPSLACFVGAIVVFVVKWYAIFLLSCTALTLVAAAGKGAWRLVVAVARWGRT